MRSGALDLVVGRDDGNVELWGLGDAAVALGMFCSSFVSFLKYTKTLRFARHLPRNA